MASLASRLGQRNLSWQIVALAVVPLFLLALSLMVTRGFAETEELRREIVRSYETRSELQRILSLHQDIETGQRGFILSSDPRFLDPYNAAEPEFDRAFDRLERTLLAEAEIEGELAALRRASEEKRRFVAELVELTRNGDAAAAQQLVAAGRGRALMDGIRALITRIDGHERAQLAARTASADQARERLRGRTIALQLLLVLLLAIAAGLAFHHSRARARATRRIEDLAARQEAIFDGAKDGMIVLDGRGSIESLNPAAACMFGYGDHDLAGRDVAILFAAVLEPGEAETFLSQLSARPDREPAEFQEFIGRCKDGATFPAEVSISPVRLADEVRFLAVLRDISERKQIERMKTEFVSTVSHELRTPLTSIAGSLGLVAGGAAGEIPARAARLVEIARSNCARLIRLINEILDIEKIEAGRMAFDIRPIPLARLLDQAAEANRAYAAEHGAMILVEPVPPGATVLGDEDRLMQVMTNLLSNAAKFSPQGGVVEILTEQRDRRWRISVADHGPGIPEDFRPRIFTKFAQADSSDTRQKGGTGLGLSIVREIATRLGGTVSFETGAGEGTTFHVDLPAAPAAGNETDNSEALGRLEDAGLPIILHVDDDPDMLRVVASLFEGRARVHSTPSAVEARASIRRYGFDAVILDVGMEDGNGLDLIPLIRERGDSAVIVFTAQDADPQHSGADCVLVKSKATLDQLVEDVLRLARRSQQADGAE